MSHVQLSTAKSEKVGGKVDVKRSNVMDELVDIRRVDVNKRTVTTYFYSVSQCDQLCLFSLLH